MPGKRIGALLMRRGLLTAEQVDAILTEQKHAHQPFGKLAHEMFGVPEREIWDAWAQQVGHLCPRVDLAVEPNDAHVLGLITSDEASRIRALPLRFEYGELVCATTVIDLPEAAATLQQRTRAPIRFVIAERMQLDRYVAQRYAAREAEVRPAACSA